MSTSVDIYAVIKNGEVTNLILWDGNADESTGGAPLASGESRVLHQEGQLVDIGFKASKDPDGNWEFSRN